MPDSLVRALVRRVAAFHLTDRAMKNAQKKIETLLTNGSAGDLECKEYVAAVRRYFAGFEAEARGHLRNLDKRLEHANQVHFNLTAERSVAVRRIEATQSILAELERAERSERG